MPRNTQNRKRAAPEPLLLVSSLLSEGRRLKSYGGNDLKLVLSLDIGTTFSAASFCILRPRCIPELEIVSAWPGQTTSDAKIPSVIYYNDSGTPMAWGAETLNEDSRARALEEGWYKAEWFKLSLGPAHLSSAANATGSSDEKTRKKTIALKVSNAEYFSAVHPSMIKRPPTLHVGVRQIYTDFIRFMFAHIQSHICKHYSSGRELWDKLFSTMEVIFAIPNGWELRQQHDIRVAAISAGLMGAHDGQMLPFEDMGVTQQTSLMDDALKRIRFVSEAEAGVIYAADSGRIDPWLKVGEDVILCDAGGGTIDITVYTIIKERPLELKEKFAPQCTFAGATLINCRAETWITDKVKGTSWDDPHKISVLMEEFERSTKKRFDLSGGDLGIGPGGTEWNEKSNIRFGRLYIPSCEFVKFFMPTLSAIKTGIVGFHNQSGKRTKNVIMVGRLMNSSYAYTNLVNWGQGSINFTKPDGTMGKAISHGALLWYLTKPVKGYITKFHYGTDVSSPIDELEMVHPGREIAIRADGVHIIEDFWETITSLGSELSPNEVTMRDYEIFFDENTLVEDLEFKEKIFICRGRDTPTFITGCDGQLHPDMEHACTIVVDLKEQFKMTPTQRNGETDKAFKMLEFEIAIMNNGYDLTAFASWKVGRKKFRGEARVVTANVSV